MSTLMKFRAIVALHAGCVLVVAFGGVALAASSDYDQATQILRVVWLTFVLYVSIVNAYRNWKEGPDAHCSWTQKENQYRVALGMDSYKEPFITRYFKAPLSVQRMLGLILLVGVVGRLIFGLLY